MPTPPYSPARIEISIPTASYDGFFWGRYPNGDKPTGLAGPAAVGVSAAGTLKTGTRFTGAASVSAAVAGVLSGGSASRIKSFMGHWIYVDQGVSKDAQFSRTQQLVGLVPEMVGCEYLWKWSDLENPNVPGDYSGNWAAAGQKGFQLVHRFADYLRSVGKKMHLNNFSYGGNAGNPAGWWKPPTPGFTGIAIDPNFFLDGEMPHYLSGSAYGPKTSATDGIYGGLWMNSFDQGSSRWSNVRSFMRFWEPAVGARMIALSQAYAAEFDSHAGFGMWSPFSESTLPTQMATYSVGADKAFWLGPNGAFAKMRQHWPTTVLRWWGNFIGSRQDMSDMQNACVANKWLCAGPDLLTDYSDSALPGFAPAWSSATTYRFGQVVTYSSVSYFCITGNTNIPPKNANGTVNVNWHATPTGTRNVDSDWVWQGKDTSGVVNPNYTNWINRGAFGHDVEPLDLDESHDDAVNFHHLMHANKLGAHALFWYDLRYNSNNTTPTWNRTDQASPNLLDWIRSCAQGGNVSVNGVVAGIRLNNDNVYPPTW